MKVLFWYTDATVGFDYMWWNRFCSFHKADPIVVDTVGHFTRKNRSFSFKSLDDAIDAHSYYTWVFLHPKGEVFLDKFQHPLIDDVVYAFGSDVDGFERDLDSLPGYTVRLRGDDEIFALHALPYVLYDRDLFIKGRRK